MGETPGEDRTWYFTAKEIPGEEPREEKENICKPVKPHGTFILYHRQLMFEQLEPIG